MTNAHKFIDAALKNLSYKSLLAMLVITSNVQHMLDFGFDYLLDMNKVGRIKTEIKYSSQPNVIKKYKQIRK